MRRARNVHDLLRPAELVDRFRHEPLRPGLARAFDLGGAVASRALGFFENAGIGFRKPLVGEERAGFWDFVVRQIDRRRRLPMPPEHLLDGLDCGGGAFDQRIAVAGVGDRRLQHLSQPHRAVVPQQQHPGFEGAGHAGRQQSGPGHHLEALAAVVRNGGPRWGRALAANHLGAAAFGVMHNDRHVAAGTVQMWLDHLQREGGGDSGVERVAALFQRGHPNCGGDPVGGGHDAKRAFDFRPGRERIGIDVAHRSPSFCIKRWRGALDHRVGLLPTAATLSSL